MRTVAIKSSQTWTGRCPRSPCRRPGRAVPPWSGSRGSPPGSPWPPWTSSRPGTPNHGTIPTPVYVGTLSTPDIESPGWCPSCQRLPQRGVASCRGPPAAPTWSCHNIHPCLYHNTRPCSTWSPPRPGLSRTARSWWRGTPGLWRARRGAAARPAQHSAGLPVTGGGGGTFSWG